MNPRRGDQRRTRFSRRGLFRVTLLGGAAFAAGRLTGVLGQRDESASPRVLVVPAPPIVPRAQWGADETRRGADARYDAKVEKIVVHHTATPNDAADWASQVRTIYENELVTGYRDLPYHLLIDPNGTIYEGRWARNSSPEAPPNGEDADGRSVRGGHARDHNERTLGIALLGDFSDASPTGAAVDALISVLVWKCARWGVDPLDSSEYNDDDGNRQQLSNILPHSQVRTTECPGSSLRGLLPDIRSRTAVQLEIERARVSS